MLIGLIDRLEWLETIGCPRMNHMNRSFWRMSRIYDGATVYLCVCQYMSIWWFPKIGVPLNHPFLDAIFPYKLINHPAVGDCWGSSIYRNPHVCKTHIFEIHKKEQTASTQLTKFNMIAVSIGTFHHPPPPSGRSEKTTVFITGLWYPTFMKLHYQSPRKWTKSNYIQVPNWYSKYKPLIGIIHYNIKVYQTKKVTSETHIDSPWTHRQRSLPQSASVTFQALWSGVGSLSGEKVPVSPGHGILGWLDSMSSLVGCDDVVQLYFSDPIKLLGKWAIRSSGICSK